MNRKGFQFFYFIISISLLFSLSACNFFGGKSSDNTRKVTFMISDEFLTSGNLLMYSRAENPSDFKVTDLKGGLNSIDIPDDGTYVLGILKASEISESARSIGGVISTLGNINIISSGLDSIPTSEDSRETIDLGDLTINQSDGSVQSSQGLEQIASATGIDPDILQNFGIFDNTLRKITNPDINGNNILDSDEELNWNLITEYSFTFLPGEIDYYSGMPVVSAADFFPDSFSWIFKCEYYPHYLTLEDNGPDRLVLPENSEGTDYIFATDSMYYLEFGTRYWTTFSYDLLPGSSAPFEGTYGINLNMKSGTTSGWEYDFSIENVSFLKPETNFNKFVFPILRIETDNQSRLQNLSIRWIKTDSGSFIPASPEEVDLMVDSIKISIPNWTANRTMLLCQDKSSSRWQIYIGSAAIATYEYKYSDVKDFYHFDDIVRDGVDTTFNESAETDSFYEGANLDLSEYNFQLELNSTTSNSITNLIYYDAAGNQYSFDYDNTAFKSTDYSFPDVSVGTWSKQSTSPFDGYLTGKAIAEENGYLYSAGGYDSDDGGLTDAVYYTKLNTDGTTGTWTAATPLPQTREDHTMVGSNGYLYIIGGQTQRYTDPQPEDTYIYKAVQNSDGSLGAWIKQTAELEEQMRDVTSVIVDSYLYLKSRTSETYKFEIQSNGDLNSLSTAYDQPTWSSDIFAYNGIFYQSSAISNPARITYAAIDSNGNIEDIKAGPTLTFGYNYFTQGYVSNDIIYALGKDSEDSPEVRVLGAKLLEDGSPGLWKEMQAIPLSGLLRESFVYNGYLFAIGGDWADEAPLEIWSAPIITP